MGDECVIYRSDESITKNICDYAADFTQQQQILLGETVCDNLSKKQIQ